MRHQRNLAKLPAFLRAKSLEPFITSELVTSSSPIIFDTGAGGSLAVGFRAQLLPQVCWVYAKARMAGKLTSTQLHVADACLKLLEALTDVAIDALVDEATGYRLAGALGLSPAECHIGWFDVATCLRVRQLSIVRWNAYLNALRSASL